MDSVVEGEGGKIWENGIEKETLMYKYIYIYTHTYCWGISESFFNKN